MCNLSQGIVDDTKVEIIKNMYENKFSLEQISLATKKSIAEIEKIIKENKKLFIEPISTDLLKKINRYWYK